MDNLFDDFILTYKELKSEAKRIEEESKSLREEWRDRIMQFGNYASAAGTITIRPVTVRSSYDKKKVERVIAKLMQVDHDLAAELAAARNDTDIAATFEVG